MKYEKNGVLFEREEGMKGNAHFSIPWFTPKFPKCVCLALELEAETQLKRSI